MRYAIINEDGAITRFTTDFKAGGLEVPAKVQTKGVKTKLDLLKQIKLTEVSSNAQSVINLLVAKYAKYEVESFADQRVEWKAWKADNTASTPVVDTLAKARGLTKEDLMARIEKNVLSIVELQGKQNALEDAIKTATTIEALESINVSLEM